MKWNSKEYKSGDTRVISRFLFFPRSINGECRWMERASIKQKLERNWVDSVWVDISWEN